MSSAVRIETLDPTHYDRIVEIYNHYILNSAITFDITPYSTETRSEWFNQFNAPYYRCFVLMQKEIAQGYACSTQFRKKDAYVRSVEVSVYLHPDATGQGFGRTLYQHLFAALAETDAHRAYAGVTLPNQASLALHRHYGFTDCGVLHEVGFKFDRYWDVQWLEKAL